MNLPDHKELSNQLRSPWGQYASEVGLFMERINKDLYQLSLEQCHLSEGEHILEIGPGNGSFVSEFFRRENDIYYTGIELSAEMHAACLQRNGERVREGRSGFLRGDILTSELPKESYDLIFGINVIYFLNPAEQYIRKLYRLLKPGGRLCLGFRDKSSMKKLPFVDDQFTLYTKEELSDLLLKFGFEYVFSETAPETTKLLDGSAAVFLNHSCLALKGKMA
ncbi:MAG TPA: class I SAM-dependent methyltransferase [Bacteroidia bacterium]|nr:class I SAM-dependent methyltransferase [Bacteroidia bacterium]